MIELYTADTPNGHRVELMLEELDLPYTKHMLSLARGEHRTAAFRQLNPSARIPVIVDHDAGDDSALVLTQSAAILLYLAEKTGKLLPAAQPNRARAMEWLSFDATDIAPTRFDAFYLSWFEQGEAQRLLKERCMEYYAVYDRHLSVHAYLAGDEYSVADVAVYPWARSMEHPGMNELEHLQRWMRQMAARPTCQKVFQAKEDDI
jgi:GST-like protein